MDYGFDEIRRGLTKAAQRTFSAYKELHPGEEFYAYALYTDHDAGGANAAANSEPALKRVMQSYLDRDRVPELGHLRYVPDEWEYTGAKGNLEEWGKIWELNETIWTKDIMPFDVYKKRSLETMFQALKDLDELEFFGTGPEREKITLLVWITDCAEAEEVWVRSVKELNPPSVYERFLTEMPSWCKTPRPAK